MLKTMFLRSAMAATAMLFAVASMAQDCADCGQGGFGWSAQDGHDSGCGCEACAQEGQGGIFSGDRWGTREWHHRWDHSMAIHHRVAARNRAWPMPFNCADRQTYFAIWDPMLAQGWMAECILSDIHFEPKTNELNSLGKSKITGIMKNMPQKQKTVFVQRDIDEQVSNERLDNVKQVVSKWYGDPIASQVVFTEYFPSNGPGNRIEAINKLYWEGTPAPIIPVATGTGGTSNISQ